MNSTLLKSIFTFTILCLIGVGVAFAGSYNGQQFGGLPLFGLGVGLIFVIQWVAFVPAFMQQSERFFDLTGSLTYISITLLMALLASDMDVRSWLIAAAVIVWAARLGTFLARRIHKDGKDGRFDELKTKFWRFLNVWTIQALWVTFTAVAALVTITNTTRKELDIFAWVGLLIWLVGFGIEAIADNQKSQFRADPANKGKFIQTGLWARSRHPNYFGEIMLWAGIAIMALPVLQGWQWIALLSPVFVTLLLTRVSGIPLLENRADEKWGGDEDYEAYKARTPVLIPRL